MYHLHYTDRFRIIETLVTPTEVTTSSAIQGIRIPGSEHRTPVTLGRRDSEPQVQPVSEMPM